MNTLFQIIFKILMGLAHVFSLTYQEVNIIVYYILLPAIFLYIIGIIRKTKVLFYGFIVFILCAWYIIPDFDHFSNYLFSRSVDFLNIFEAIGLNYIEASVVICVFIPLILIVLLIWMSKKF